MPETMKFTHHNWLQRLKFFRTNKNEEMKIFQKLAECTLGGSSMILVTCDCKMRRHI